eukprot:TRINITY_DN46939_c0_g1_i1.p1 TRINITY_DN46939_c0_g1~~TRINITY_DN46939_c0_g1_i1.p1  ORF type:complete len:640 (+),score=53.83 TRINITY_DN46939_c0_g1_i1:24-1922(+)
MQTWLFGLLLVVECVAQSPTITLPIGKITGVNTGSTWEFLGVPFATAARWKPPQNLMDTPFSGGSYDATKLGPCCAQLLTGAPMYIPPSVGTADSDKCLNMNIFTPQNVQSTDKRPVMIWIYGGSGTLGCINQDVPLVYNGTNLINGVSSSQTKPIIITINYRLGVYATIYLDYLAKESGMSGNYGHMDILAAIKWVKKHASNFGGDPNKITLFGESYGGDYSMNVITAEGSAGLVNRVITESAPAGFATSWGTPALVEGYSKQLIKAIGCEKATEADSVACLRALDVQKFPDTVGRAVIIISVVDGKLYKQVPVARLTGPNPPAVDVIMGFNQPDMFAVCAGLYGPLQGNLQVPADASIRTPLIQHATSTLTTWGWGNVSQQLVNAYGLPQCDTAVRCCLETEHVLNDGVFGCNARRLLLGLARGGRKAYMYKMDCHNACPVPDGKGGTIPATMTQCDHGSEISYVFGTEGAYANKAGRCPFNSNMRQFSQALIKRWVAFADTGNPDSAWVPITCGNEAFLNITQFDSIGAWKMEPLVGNQQCNIFDGFVDKQVKATFGNSMGVPGVACPCTTPRAQATSSCIVKLMANQIFGAPCSFETSLIGCQAQNSCQSEEMTEQCHKWKCSDVWGC